MLRNGKIGVKNVLSITKYNHSATITINTYTGTTDIQEAASWTTSWTSCELLNKNLT